MEAVGVGYVFNLFDEGDLPGVDLRETGEYVRVDGSLYPLMKAATYEQSRMVDAALDIRGERRVDDFRWEEPRLPDGRGALAALLGGDDFYNPGAGIYLDSYLNDREPELIVRRCSLDGFERLVGRMRDDGEDYRDGAVAPFEAAEKASDGDESIPLDEVGGLTRIASYAEKLAGDGWIPAGADLDSFVERAHEVEMGPRPLKVGLIDIGKEPRIVAVEADEDGSHLHGLQALVGGFIEPFTPLYGDEPCLYVNEDGIGEGLAPNRAIYASRRMQEEGYLSQLDYSRVVEEGQFYAVLFGPIVAVSYDEVGTPRDITQAEFDRLCADLGGDDAQERAIAACLAIRRGREPEPRLIREEGGIDLDAEALDAREVSEGMAGRDAHEHGEPTR